MARRYCSSIEELAAEVGRAPRTVHGWRARYPDTFPGKGPKGYRVSEFRQFMRLEGLEKQAARDRPVKGNPGSRAHEEVLWIRARRERDELRRQQQEIQLELTRGRILLADDMATFFAEIVSTAKAVLQSAIDRRESEIGLAGLPDDVTARLLAADRRMFSEFCATMEGLTLGNRSDSEEAIEVEADGEDEDD